MAKKFDITWIVPIFFLFFVVIFFIALTIFTNGTNNTLIIVFPFFFYGSNISGSKILFLLLSLIFLLYFLYMFYNWGKFQYIEKENETTGNEIENFHSKDSSKVQSNIRTKGIIMIGPIPLIWGFGNRKNKALILITMFLIYLLFMYIVIY